MWPFDRKRLLAGTLGLAGCLLGLSSTVLAHHSYSMFDDSKKVTVSGTVAKLEWTNPHVFLWLYVPNSASPGKYDLYAFENGSLGALTRLGWSATVLKPGDKITVEYWPLKDGRKGGHCDKAILANGRALYGAGGPAVKDGRAPRPEFELPKQPR